jgi:hypothetical protein
VITRFINRKFLALIGGASNCLAHSILSAKW